jgi:hypothetical protein
MSNPIIKVLKHYGAPLTRQEFLDTAYLGKPPANLDPESEAELPDEPRFQKFRPTTHEEVAAEEAAKKSKKK